MTEPHYFYPEQMTVGDGNLAVTVELAYGSDAVEITFSVDDGTWANWNARRDETRAISRADWEAIVAHVRREHDRWEAR